jgi:hypothetical protein
VRRQRLAIDRRADLETAHLFRKGLGEIREAGMVIGADYEDQL